MKFLNSGFTLIEELMVIATLGLLAIIGSNLFFGTLFGSSKSEILKEVKQNGEYALKVMEETIKNSAGLELCDSATITVKDRNNQTISFSVASDRIASTASNRPEEPYYLTSNKVKIENFSLDCVNEPGSPPTINISFDVRQKEQTSRVEKTGKMNFSTTVTMRNF